MFHATLSLFQIRVICLSVCNVTERDREFLFQAKSRYEISQILVRRGANIVFSPHFESGFVKIIREESLTQLGEAAVRVFEKSDACSFFTESTADFAEELLKNSQKNSKYEDLSWILPTSNELERFFSEAEYVLGSYRDAILPQNLEAQLFFTIISFFGQWNQFRKC